ncbi:hypothetical protein HY345_01605 [Candidatus Microgenomates bacterium]|nr:hypothetical protein [Candidatus Microgenomates bacterium]
MTVVAERLNPVGAITNSIKSGLEGARTRFRNFVAPKTLPFSELQIVTPRPFMDRDFTGGREQPATLGSDFMFGAGEMSSEKKSWMDEVYSLPEQQKLLDKPNRMVAIGLEKTMTRYVPVSQREEFHKDMQNANSVRTAFETVQKYGVFEKIVTDIEKLQNKGTQGLTEARQKAVGLGTEAMAKINNKFAAAAASAVPIFNTDTVKSFLPPLQESGGWNMLNDLINFAAKTPSAMCLMGMTFGALYGTVRSLGVIGATWKEHNHSVEAFSQQYEAIEEQLRDQQAHPQPGQAAITDEQIERELARLGHAPGFGDLMGNIFGAVRGTVTQEIYEWGAAATIFSFFVNTAASSVLDQDYSLSNQEKLAFLVVGGLFTGIAVWKAIEVKIGGNGGHGGHH